eukprot:TRINITY_DN5372_c0_g1_i1.p1 TRINITY_DN5372_c0_g1~~TRINITY_DN5372_c0_g1_i1.p1  ORF type:complete len:610 (+),score=188.34 TRINITY_DN5372_c0_g1_i1:275-2104(+)
MTQRSSREQWRKEQATLEAQREGNIPPDTDEDGNAINPHIPQYMAKPPWWLHYDDKTLKHQRKVPDVKKGGMDEWYKRGAVGEAATKYRKGACKNCGAMTHKEKECTERPRKVKAAVSGKDIAADEVVTDVSLSWEGKHDRWNGVDLRQHQKEVSEKHKVLDTQRQLLKQEKIKNKIFELVDITEDEVINAEKRLTELVSLGIPIVRDNIVENKVVVAEKIMEMSEKDQEDAKGCLLKLLKVIPESEGGLADDDAIEELAEDQDKEQEDINADGGALTNKVDLGGVRDGVEAKVTSRNLRIREDTAKYLRNLSMDPAFHYDPKTRSQRANPYPDKAPDEVDYAGDSWVRSTGDSTTVDKMQVFCWDATRNLQEKGQTAKYINMQANPTAAERAFKQHEENKELIKTTRENALLDQYGGAEHLKTLPDELRVASEGYTEYRPDGTLIKGVEKATPRSKYEEDVYRNNHTAVWGSYWNAGQWGYKCCKQTMKNSICVRKTSAGNEGGEKQTDKEEEVRLAIMQKEIEAMEKKLEEEGVQAEKEAARKKKRQAEDDEKDAKKKKKKAKAATVGGTEITEDEMLAYRRNKVAFDDPMKEFLRREAAEGSGDDE